jgi:hypothetical protein
MAISLRGIRRKRATATTTAGPSLREVCLIGGRPVAEGERLTWSGRVYRVETARAGYAHLTPAPDRAGTVGTT